MMHKNSSYTVCMKILEHCPRQNYSQSKETFLTFYSSSIRVCYAEPKITFQLIRLTIKE